MFATRYLSPMALGSGAAILRSISDHLRKKYSSLVENRNGSCMLLSKSLGDQHANYIQNHDHLGLHRPHTHIQYTCCKHRKQFSVHHDTLWLKWEEGRMEPGIPSPIADVMRVHLKMGSSRYIKLKHVVSDHQKSKNKSQFGTGRKCQEASEV